MTEPDPSTTTPGVEPISGNPEPPLPQLAPTTPAPVSAVSVPIGAPAPFVTKQGAWGLWWLCVLTLGIYYVIWYHRINKELATVLREPVPPNGIWINPFIPIWSFVGLGATAKRLNRAHASVGSPTRVGLFTTWFWAPIWFASQPRYLQRRINTLHDVLAALATRGV